MMNKRLKPELLLCTLLMCVVILAWTSFLAFLHQSASERAAFWFMRNHLELGESPDFVLRTARQGLPQPFDLLITWREFQVSLAFSLILVVGLAWLMYLLWKTETRIGHKAFRVTAITQAAVQQAHAADAPAGAIKIGRFLKEVSPIYQSDLCRGAADGQAVGPPSFA